MDILLQPAAPSLVTFDKELPLDVVLGMYVLPLKGTSLEHSILTTSMHFLELHEPLSDPEGSLKTLFWEWYT